MSGPQIDAMDASRQERPELDEWWVRFVKAWCKADGLTAEECGGE